MSNPPGITAEMQHYGLDAVKDLNRLRQNVVGDPEIASRIASYELAFRMQSAAPELMELSGESAATLEAYGVDREDPKVATERGIGIIADGSNADDRGDYRPGRQAAREFGVRSPLDEADLTKDEIRALSREMGLSTADEPASACLSSRIPYASEVTVEKLRMIEQAEDVLRRLGFRICRVRHHDTLARLEIDRSEMARALDPEVNAALVRELKAIGYKYVSLDLQGYRMGSLNEVLRLIPA
jgi:hypothetical protein